MGNHLFKALLFISLWVAEKSSAQMLVCGQDNFYQLGSSNCIWRYNATNLANPTGFSPFFPGSAVGLAIAPNFFNNGPNPTFYTTVNGVFYYYNGSSFVSTGHIASSTNIGGSGNFIYSFNSAGQVAKYNGTGPSTIIATYTNLANSAVQDIVGDANNNFYLIKSSNPSSLNVYNAAGTLISSYPIVSASNTLPFTDGFTINKSWVTIGNNRGQLSNNSLSMTVSFFMGCGGATDLATCPEESYLVPAIRAVPSATLPCNGGTITLTSDDLSNSQTYVWSGPGIVGSTTSQSIVANVAGVYSRTMSTIAGVPDVSTFTVYQGNQLPLQVVASSTLKCDYDAPVTFTVTGLGNYTWSPSTSLSSSTGSIVNASPIAVTNYMISGSLNGCVGSTVITITAAAAIPTPSITVPNPSICIGSSALVSTNASSLNIQWSPGTYSSNFVIVTPSVSTVYTLVLSNAIGCSKTATADIIVATFPNFTAAASQTKICEGTSVNLNMTGASSYTVYPGNLNGASVSLNPLAATVYTVVGANWICSTTQQVFIDVMPLPQFSVVSSVSQICEGQSVSISLSGNGNTYTLLPGNASGTTFAVSPQTSLVYTVVASNRSCTATQQLPLTVNALPQLTVSSSAAEICVGESAVITVAGANSYSWTNGPNTAQYQVSPASTTTYQVSGSSSDGCNNTTTFVQRVSECTGIENTASAGAVRFYPNPGNGQIEVEANSVPNTARIEVRNYLGQVVLASTISESIDISAFTKGVYVVSVLDNATTLYHVKYVLQ